MIGLDNIKAVDKFGNEIGTIVRMSYNKSPDKDGMIELHLDVMLKADELNARTSGNISLGLSNVNKKEYNPLRQKELLEFNVTMNIEIGDKVRIKLSDLENALLGYIDNNPDGFIDGDINDMVTFNEDDLQDEYYVNIKLPNVLMYAQEITVPSKRLRHNSIK